MIETQNHLFAPLLTQRLSSGQSLAFPSTTIAAIILAGGKSRRMGQDKAAIVLGGISMLARVHTVASQCCADVLVVTFTPERYQHLLPKNCQFVRESTPSIGGGPLNGFAVGLAQISTPWVLLLACDLPNLDIGTIQQWAIMCHQLPACISAALPRGKKGWEPLCGFYRTDQLSNLQAFLSKGGTSFQSWLQEKSVYELPLTSPNMLLNCNTPGDIQKFQG